MFDEENNDDRPTFSPSRFFSCCRSCASATECMRKSMEADLDIEKQYLADLTIPKPPSRCRPRR